MAGMEQVYKIQSKINSKFGATIHPKAGGGIPGYYFHMIKDKKALTASELRNLAGEDVLQELGKECQHLVGCEVY